MPNYRRTSNAESDLGYSTMTPQDDSEHANTTCHEPLIIGRNRYRPPPTTTPAFNSILPPPPSSENEAVVPISHKQSCHQPFHHWHQVNRRNWFRNIPSYQIYYQTKWLPMSRCKWLILISSEWDDCISYIMVLFVFLIHVLSRCVFEAAPFWSMRASFSLFL